MGMQLPPELADVAAKTGVKWPEADEDKMREAAQAWRDTGTKLTSLISEADSTARAALSTTEGASADAARKHWSTYVQPDTGHLTKVANGCTAAADQLDHAANQVGQAKLAIVQQLTPLAKNLDVADQAATAGNPTALLGVDTAVRGTAANLANLHTNLVSAVQPATGVVMDTVQPIVDTNPGHRVPLGPVVDTGAGGHGHHGQGLPGVVDSVASPVVDAVAPGGPGQHGRGGDVLPPGFVDPGRPGVLDPVPGGHDPATGPIPLPDRPGNNLPPDAPTPPGGFQRPPDHHVQAAAAAAVLDAPPAAPVASPNQPPPAAPPPPAAQFVGGNPPPAPVQPGPVAAQPVPPAQPGQPAAPQPRGPVGEQARPMPVAAAPAPPPAPVAAAAQPAHAAPPPAKQERETVLAIWLVRMFPLGHMPIASDRPSRQLPPPSPEFDYAAGMRFEPHDHPESHLIDARPGDAFVEASPPAPDAVVAKLTEGHDPLAGQNERDWDRRFVVRAGSGRDTLDTEYAWPPAELSPEGATAPGEPEILEPGAEIDRFGTPEGRVFAAAGTRYGRRSLPPSHVSAGYRRYRVLKPLPVWRGISAAWFGQPGGGVRYRTVYPAIDLIALGYLAEETVDEG